MNNLMAVVDATCQLQLDLLTLHRMPGALPFAGKFRLIDFTLSSLRNSQVTNVAIFPYGNYRSLQDHVGSGKRWDLDRRRDGLFILPPKNLNILPSTHLSFQRMYEHLEYFTRSKQKYVIITALNIVWNIDFNDVLKQHIQTEADVTEVMYENIRNYTFIIARELLMEYIKTYDTLEYRNMPELVEKAQNLKVFIYRHKKYTRTITDPFNYIKCNLDMLSFDIGRQIFREDRPILSKEKTSPPALYQHDARVDDSMVSSGAIINGTVIHSIIGRDVVIKKGAIVKNSVIMPGSLVEENAYIEYAILDKETIVKEKTVLLGSLREPYLAEKGRIITGQNRLHILFAASESYPFVKTGGLADVVGSLSRNLIRQGIDVTVVLPLYKKIKDSFLSSLKREEGKRVAYGDVSYFIRKYSTIYKKVRYIFIESHDFFDAEQIYAGDKLDTNRFAFFSKAVVAILQDLPEVDLIHLHDWHTSLIPLLLKQFGYHDLKTLLTIHNIDYQGIASTEIIKKLGISDFVFRSDTINFLELGIYNATKLSTVSPTYRSELRYEYYGKNLTDALQLRERDFYGILNGVSSSFNPENDRLLYANYGIHSVKQKQKNKAFLQSKMSLSVSNETFVIGMVTRIVEQKGFDILIPALDDLLGEEDIQFILLGTGQKQYVDKLYELEKKYPDKVRLNIGYDSAVPSHIYAGSDVFLMPSRVEPCGLGQMIALAYGTLPIVRDTGGLADTIQKYDPITKKGNGFKFYNYDAIDLKYTILEALNIFQNEPSVWETLIQRAMKSDNSLKKMALKYIELYKTTIEN
jgi:starch synthase